MSTEREYERDEAGRFGSGGGGGEKKKGPTAKEKRVALKEAKSRAAAASTRARSETRRAELVKTGAANQDARGLHLQAERAHREVAEKETDPDQRAIVEAQADYHKEMAAWHKNAQSGPKPENRSQKLAAEQLRAKRESADPRTPAERDEQEAENERRRNHVPSDFATVIGGRRKDANMSKTRQILLAAHVAMAKFDAEREYERDEAGRFGSGGGGGKKEKASERKAARESFERSQFGEDKDPNDYGDNEIAVSDMSGYSKQIDDAIDSGDKKKAEKTLEKMKKELTRLGRKELKDSVRLKIRDLYMKAREKVTGESADKPHGWSGATRGEREGT